MDALTSLAHIAAAEWARTNTAPGVDPVEFGENVRRVYRACLSPAPTPATKAAIEAADKALVQLWIGAPPETTGEPVMVSASILVALQQARMALVTSHNVLATDRPDLPRAPDTGWTTNFLKEIAAIDAAVEMLVGAGRRTDPECDRCSTCPETLPSTSPARCAQELPGSRSQPGARS